MANPTVDYLKLRDDSQSNTVFGGLGDLLNQFKPVRNEANENDLKRMAKYAALTDIMKTIGEGLALTITQNTGNGAVPTIVPRGENKAIGYADQKLTKLKDDYNNQENIYNQQLLAQKLREIQYNLDKDKYNRGLEAKQIEHDYNAKLNDDAIAKDEKRYNDAIARQKQQDAKEQAEKDKNRQGVYDPYTNDPGKSMIYFNEQGQQQAAIKYVASKYPEVFSPVTEVVDNGVNKKTTQREPTMNEIEARMLKLKLSKQDINNIAMIANDPRRYDPELVKRVEEEKPIQYTGIIGFNPYFTREVNNNQITEQVIPESNNNTKGGFIFKH